ncbi:MAG: heme-binding protein [Rhodospirillaceae bacterium]|nr:heme-binding protein [Rhodospirillaceae bacterium]
MLSRSFVSLLGSTLLAGCSVVGVRAGTEQPKYEVLARPAEAVEVRQYGNRIAAEVTVNRGRRGANENAAFGALASYIFGKNQSRTAIAMTSPVESRTSEKIAMTAPVETASTGQSMTMRFYLPSEYTLDEVPKPLNPNVEIIPISSETIATLKFSGLRSSTNVATHTAQLLDRLDGTRWAITGEPVAYFYDPPWTVPTLRRNEIAVTVEKQDEAT